MSKIKHVFTGVFIPANIWLSNELTPAEKMILGEVEALSKETGWCYAGRKHFTEWLHCTPPNITYYIAHLEELGFLKVERSPGERSRMQIISERFYEKGSKEGLPGSKEGLRVGSKEGLPGSKEGLPASYIKEKENYKIQKKENANAEASLLPPYKKVDEIETERFSFDDEKNPPYPQIPAAPLSPNGAAVRISLRDPDLPGVQIIDEVKPEPKTQPEKTGRGKAKNGRSIEPTIHPENETVFAHFNNPEKARAAWLTWIRYKAAEHRERYKSAETELIKIRSLFRDAAADSETAAQMIEQSIGNLWRGIFKIKDQKNGQQIGNLNAAQRQHLNLANYIAQRRIAAMERAANGGSVD